MEDATNFEPTGDNTRKGNFGDAVFYLDFSDGSAIEYIPMNPRTDRLAQAGFVVVCMGHRGGHPSRSKWYHNYGYGNLRDYPMADHKVAIEQLCARYKFMDINRVGIQ